jgi:periplasmic copper chaperone A
MRARSLAALVLAGGLLVATSACGDSDDEAATTTTTAAAAAEEITVSDAWCRTSPAMASAGACYMVIENGSGEADALVKAGVPSSVAGTVELHETVPAESEGTMGTGGDEPEGMAEDEGTGDQMMDDSGTTMAGSGMMKMQPVAEIPLPAGETVALEPGGLHVMLLDLPQPLTTGSTVEFTLTFERAPAQTVSAEVREN